MTRYVHKDKTRQEKLDALCEVEKFSEKLQEACKDQFSDDFNFVDVFFGSVATEDGDGLKTDTFEYSVRLLKDDIEVIEDLKPGVWYPREMFDGNPNGYLLIETYINSDFYASHKEELIHSLIDDTTHFMYLERLEVSNEQD